MPMFWPHRDHLGPVSSEQGPFHIRASSTEVGAGAWDLQHPHPHAVSQPATQAANPF